MFNQLNAEIGEKNFEKTRLETINMTIDYKQHESDKNGIDERLEKLTRAHYDEKKTTAELANTICMIAEKEINNLDGEHKSNKDKLYQANTKLGDLKKAEGELGIQLNQCKKNISDSKDQKYEFERKLSDIDKELSIYPNYSNSLLDEEELRLLEELKGSVEVELKDMRELINQNKEDTIRAKGEKENTEAIIQERKKQLIEKNEWIEGYKSSLKEITLKTSAQENDIDETCSQLKKQVERLSKNGNEIDKSIDGLNDEISILEDYGFLRSRSKYDALNFIKGDWKFAKFGSDILKEIDEEKSRRILDRFPGFAEVVIVADEDYKRVSEGKKTVNVAVAKENLVLMPWSSINKFDDEIQFDSLFLLTRDSEYYRNLLNPQEAMEVRANEINKLSERQNKLASEKQIIESQIELMSAHIHKYPIDVIAKYFEDARRLENEISTLKAIKLQKEQRIRAVGLKYEELKDKCEKLEQEKIEVFEKYNLLIKKVDLISEFIKINDRIKDLTEGKSNLEHDMDNNQADLNIAQNEKEQLEKAIERIKENIRRYRDFIKGSEGYKDQGFGFLAVEEIANLHSKFLVAKHVFDEKAQNYDELVERQGRLDKVMRDIQEDHRFEQINFSKIYALNYIEKISTEEFRILDMKIKELTAKKLKAEEEKNTAKAELISCRNEYEKLEDKITVYFEKFQVLDTQELYRLERECQATLLKVDNQIEASKKAIADLTSERNTYENELAQFRVFCDTNALKWQTAVQSDTIYSYEEMQKNYVIVKDEYDKAIGKINLEIKKLYATIQKLSVSEQLKVKLKEYLTDKRMFDETIQLVKLLLQTSEIINTTIRNLETSIDNIGRLDEEIAEQVFRMLKTILDEIAKIPKYSKFKYGESTKESFKINLSDENSCRIENEIALSRLKAYVYELANSVQNEGMSKKEIQNRLSISNIMQYGVDFDKLNIQILKIEQEKPKYYSWGRLSASSAQSYVTYVMFAITMIKYFNTVTVISDKMKFPIFVFLDNPFSSASSVELWEPVRRFLDKSNAQLLCLAHNVPSSAQILFDKHMIIEQTKNAKGQFINTIRNEKSESKEIIQMQLFDHLEIE